MESVKAAMALAFGAMVASKQVAMSYDCSLSGGGFGWGVAIAVQK